ncbi:hypothetical protein [Halalkalibacter okhensis]|uniref:Uncharacterized protein n=1 Tax=Halalkalibacter okhensis TaxID=333138 RepID=A0A0B0I9P6_9BACI|nr:hypothetical protein [Halalkalibacter okhensis]KHF39263.1 hypothetical protein LQ50_16295 [Halalkalibacter okhensis]
MEYLRVYDLLVVLLTILFLIALTLFIRRISLSRMVKGLIIAAGMFAALSVVFPYFGYQFYFIVGFIEWSTKFIFPWIVLYWVIRGIKALEKKV